MTKRRFGQIGLSSGEKKTATIGDDYFVIPPARPVDARWVNE